VLLAPVFSVTVSTMEQDYHSGEGRRDLSGREMHIEENCCVAGELSQHLHDLVISTITSATCRKIRILPKKKKKSFI
jgi:hypothetical protein